MRDVLGVTKKSSLREDVKSKLISGN
jgi:hypothetical protein